MDFVLAVFKIQNMGLTEAQATAVKGTWKKVSEDLKNHSTKIFVK